MLAWILNTKPLNAGSMGCTSRRVPSRGCGGGAQSIHMGRELYATQPLFRQILDECDALLRASEGLSLLEALYPATSEHDSADLTRIDEMAYMQPALFAIEYALASLGQRQGASAAPKQFFLQHAFERRNLRADGGLGDVQFFRRLAQAAFLGHDPEVSEVMVVQKFHASRVFALT